MPKKYPCTGVFVQKGTPTWVFLTVCTFQREPWLCNAKAQILLEQAWESASAWLIADYLLMPDHLHCFCVLSDPAFSMDSWVKYWKSVFRRSHDNPGWRFQSRSWHHRLRTAEEYAKAWHYVMENPQRKGLIREGESWLFRGRLHDVVW